MKSRLSRCVRFIREGVKQLGTRAAGKSFRSKSYSIFGVPAGLTSGIGPGEGTMKALYPSQPISLRPPKTIDEKIFWSFEANLKDVYVVPEEGILTLPNGMATSKGGNLAASGKLVETFLQPIDGKPPHQHDLFRFSTAKFFPRIYHADCAVLTLAAGWQGAFYHWVYEVLPRLHLAEKGRCSYQKIYVETSFPFQKESLELLGIAPERIINAHEYAAVQAPELVIPSIPLTPTDWTCQFLRDQFLPKLEKRAPLRLYISRNDATRRRIVNEDEVFGFLEKYGFQKVSLCNLTFKEQAEVFQAAEVVVGPHGAGFSHLAFCQPKTPFLEIFSPAYFHPCYWHISNRVGLGYHYLFGEGKRYPDGFVTGLDPDIVVDSEKLKASLQLMGL